MPKYWEWYKKQLKIKKIFYWDGHSLSIVLLIHYFESQSCKILNKIIKKILKNIKKTSIEVYG